MAASSRKQKAESRHPSRVSLELAASRETTRENDMLPIDKEKSTQAVSDFVTHWRGSDRAKELPKGDFRIKSSVTYMFKRTPQRKLQVITDWTTVHFHRHGMSDGKIGIDDSGNINHENCHMEFNKVWQNYRFDKKSKILVIEGTNSIKMGEFTVQIDPR